VAANLTSYAAKQLLDYHLGALSGNSAADPSCTLSVMVIEEADAMLKVAAKTADYTVVRIADYRTLLTNSGAAGTITFTLPPGVAGDETGEFYAAAAQIIRVLPATGERFTLDFTSGTLNALGTAVPADQTINKYLEASAVVGSSIRFRCKETGKWSPFEKNGTWTIQV
jgi:hypothetical protein